MANFTWNKKKGAEVFFVSEEAKGQDLFDFAAAHSAFKGKKGEVYSLSFPGKANRFLVGLGKEEALEDKNAKKEALRLGFFKLAKKAAEVKEEGLQIKLEDFAGTEDAAEFLSAALDGILEADYKFTKKTQDEAEEEPSCLNWDFVSESLSEESFKAVVSERENFTEGLFLARDLVNETSNTMYPEVLAEKAEEKLSPLGIELTVLDKKAIEEKGMEAFLSVGKGSDKEPRFIVMTYTGDPDSEERTALVGKGLTYDSGGYCLKSPRGMSTMHADMGGAGTVIGTLYALAKNKVKVNATGVVAACENLISGHAYKTGDIIGSLSGKTIEVLNTDAEGRLTLADALYYASSETAATRVIDLATLTGAAVAALSDEYTAALTNDETYFEAFREAAEASGEKVWLLPNDENLRKKIKEMSPFFPRCDLLRY